MLQIAYFSTATVPQTADVLHRILVISRANNLADRITGLLVAGGNRYMQVIEGPRAPMEKLWATIRADQRHCAVARLLYRDIDERAFKSWSMAFRREDRIAEFDSFPQTLRFLTSQVEDGALRSQIELFARSFILSPANETVTPWGSAA
ncbi:MAG: BLUF domain-containing protein [Sphingomicrobium sp.]